MGQDTPSAIQDVRPEQRYGSQPYFSGQQYTTPTTAAQPYTAVPFRTLRLPSRTLRLPSRTLHLITICLLCQLDLPSQSDILARVAVTFCADRGATITQKQLLREKQEFDAWRASRAQAKTQSQPQIFSEAEANVEVNVDSSERSASAARARPQDQVTKLRLHVQGLPQHLADPPLPRGTTLGGLACH